MRGRSRPKGPNPLTRSYESNGPDVKIRGTAQHIADKYAQLARDAQSSGDPVSAENYHQHAEHYYRLIAAAQEQFRQQYGIQRPFDEDGEEGDEEGANGFGYGERPNGQMDDMGEAPYQPQPYPNGERNQQRYDRQDRNNGDRGGQDRGQDRGNQDRNGGDRNQRFDRYDRNGGDRNNRDRNGQDRNGGQDRGGQDRAGYDRNGGDRNGGQERNYDRNNGQERSAQDRAPDRNGQDRGPDRNQDRSPERSQDGFERPERAERQADRPERVPGDRPERRERYQRGGDARRERAPRGEQPRPSEDEVVQAELPAFLTAPIRSVAATSDAEPELPIPAAPESGEVPAEEARPKRRPRVRRTAEAAVEVEKAAE
jgi:hypothetical protein